MSSLQVSLLIEVPIICGGLYADLDNSPARPHDSGAQIFFGSGVRTPAVNCHSRSACLFFAVFCLNEPLYQSLTTSCHYL